jgi:hypothetical protein
VFFIEQCLQTTCEPWGQIMIEQELQAASCFWKAIASRTAASGTS